MADNTGTLPSFDVVLDTSGLYCPEPIMLMHNKVRDMTSGQVLKVIATDPATTRDVPKFCQFLGHELLEQDTASESNYLYFIRLA
ncbi:MULTISPECIES: sulfurtransferase TusA [Halomonadaceae]|uniref:Sulfurtransferase TusA n=1 Tax=Vreelandella maris TaxID=2729617 RepID=A0A7Y6VAD4_9GAMM|nr:MULTISPECIES: sulfurtransferase TusA [Halomonas]AJY50237.1 SirA-like domain-containing protein [Halomonas sp. KO116]NVF15897.1 sulfurtransferase TusA [Halomonas maris]PKG54653.1 sulfurtransferase TusA [Halomonas sp. MES3-P3E]|tara:strand:- start:560 stop:814 length:255 start_codon:yes stop_codon:yes gene_type:complete